MGGQGHPSQMGGYAGLGQNQSTVGGMFGGAAAGGAGGGALNLGASGDESVWETAKGWLDTAGKKVAEVEGEVWKKINEMSEK
jgi:hypothetical protein